MTSSPTRAERIAAARRALAERYAADPDGVERFNARMARLTQARKREQQRIDHLVLGKPRPKPADVGARLVRPAGMPKTEWKVERQRLIAAGAQLEPEIERAVLMRERAARSGGTPETEAAAALHTDSFVQLQRNGTLTNDQVEWATEIANVFRSMQSEVAISVASLEARVDESRNQAMVVERVRRVRLHLAYGLWRDQLPDPKQMVLDMIVGDPIGYTVAAKRYRVGNIKAKQRLVAAIDAWPECVDKTYRLWSDAEIREVRDAA